MRFMLRRWLIVVATALTISSLAGIPAQAAPRQAADSSAAQHYGYTLPAGVSDPCPAPSPGQATCAALIGVRSGASSSATTTAPAGYGPPDLRSAYGFPSASSGSGQTVAIVTPHDDPSAETDMGTYRTQYGIPSCTTANGCFMKVDQNGGSHYPVSVPAWSTATAESVDMISAICPNCHILLVEANSTSIRDLGTAENTAVNFGAKFIDNTWYAGETSFGASETTYDSQYFSHPGVAITAPAGDQGYGTVNYPAASQYVTAVGGTTLVRNTGTARGWTETAWSGTSSGCSAYEPKPTWQTDTGCSMRSVSDIAAVADPSPAGGSTVAVYNTASSGWEAAGGTTLAAAIIAAAYALAGAPAANTYPASYPYTHPGGSYTTPGNTYPYAAGLFDISSGSTGTCSPSYLCTAGPGYDGPTGLGTPASITSLAGSGSVTGSIYSGVTGMCLDDSNGSTANGNKVDVWACNTNAAAQSWTDESNGTVRIGGSCLDVTNGGTSDGTKIQLWSCLGNANQQWQPESDGTLVNPQSGKCLDDPSSSATNGTQLQIYTCNGTGEQQWTLPSTVPSATGAINYQASTAKCIDDTNNATTNNNKVQIWDCLGDSAQNWTVAANGTLQINGKCMATLSDGTSDGTSVVLYSCTGDTNQQWRYRSDGSLVNVRSGTCLDDPNGVTTNGQQLQILTCSTNGHQSWTIP